MLFDSCDEATPKNIENEDLNYQYILFLGLNLFQVCISFQR